MATGTAWYNLTKPASTENYNLNVWNTNLDMIDEQMHQNETTPFTGATELANGTVGNVPAPTTADKDKFLKGDGTWAEAGSSNVEANPSGTPTDTLESIGINNVIYQLPEGGDTEITGDAEGSIIAIDDGKLNEPLKACTVDINPVQSGSGDPSPDNIRPISGWTGANVYDDAVYGGTIDFNQLVPTTNKDFTSENTDTRAYINAIFRRKTSPYTIFLIDQFSSTGNKNYIFEPTESISCEFVHNGWLRNMVFIDTVSVIANHIYILLTDFTSVDTSTVGGVTIKDMQLIDLTRVFGETKATEIYDMELATAGTGVAYFKSLFYKDYYAYNKGEYTCVSAVNGDTDEYKNYSITFPSEAGTVYGGTLDVKNGVLTVTDGYIASYDGETLPSTWISDRDVYSAGTTPTTGAEVVYKLATPTEISLTPTEITTLYGKNVIWADSGDMAITYVRDTSIAINDALNQSITPTYSSGTKIADYNIGGQTGAIYVQGAGGHMDTLWTGNETPTMSYNPTITLSHPISDYDFLLVNFNNYNGNFYLKSTVTLYGLTTGDYVAQEILPAAGAAMFAHIINDYNITLNCYGGSYENTTYVSIIGVKL